MGSYIVLEHTHTWSELPGAETGQDGWISGQATCITCGEFVDFYYAPGHKKPVDGPSGSRGPDDSGIVGVVQLESSTESAEHVNSARPVERQRHKPDRPGLT